MLGLVVGLEGIDVHTFFTDFKTVIVVTSATTTSGSTPCSVGLGLLLLPGNLLHDLQLVRGSTWGLLSLSLVLLLLLGRGDGLLDASGTAGLTKESRLGIVTLLVTLLEEG